MNDHNNTKNDAPASSIWGYSLYNIGGNALGGILGSFLTLYLTDNLLLSTSFIAALMLFGRIFNAAMEFLMGLVIDNVNSKYGKARPWIIGCSLFTALPVFLLFNTPAGLGETGTKIWVAVMYLLHIAVFGAAISIAFSALLVKVTRNPNTRVKMTNLSSLTGQVSKMLASSYGIPILMYFGGYETGYLGMSAIFCTIGFLGMLATGIICKELPEDMEAALSEQKAKLEAKRKRLPLKVQLSYILKNRYSLPMLLMFSLCWFGTTLTNSATIYFVRDIMGNVGYMKTISFARTIPVIVIAVLNIAPFCSMKFGKSASLMMGSFTLAAGFAVMLFAPANANVILFGNILYGIGSAFSLTLMKAVIGDVADYVNRTNNSNVAGIVSSVAAVGMRLGTALGSTGLAVLLDMGGYSGEAAKAGLAQAEKALLMEKMAYIYIPLFCFVVLIFICHFMNVDKEIQKLEQAGGAA